MQSTKYRLIVLSTGHGLNDFTAGYMLGNLLAIGLDMTHVAGAFLAYNLLAFGGQFFAAKIMAKHRHLKPMLILTALANGLAACLFFFSPYAGLLLAGGASACYHVAGGTACMENNRATHAGVFAAPGIIGLAIAGYLAYRKIDVWWPLCFVLFLFAVLLRWLPLERNVVPADRKQASHSIDRHDVFMIVLLGVIALRSAVWNIVQIIHDQDYVALLYVAGSAFAGKIIGGWLADRIGWKIYSTISLVSALPFLTFFKEELTLLCIGVGLLQSAIPAHTALMVHYCKGEKEKAIAFSFGTAVVLGVLLAAPLQLLSLPEMITTLFAGSILLTAVLFYKKYGLRRSD